MAGAYIQTAEPTSLEVSQPAPRAPTPIRPGTPVVFLNPAVVLTAAFTVGMVRDTPATAVGHVGEGSLRNGGAEALTSLCATLGAVVVITDTSAPVDPVDQLMMQGARFVTPVDRTLDREDQDRAGAITRWRAAHGNPVSIVIDRPGVQPPQTVTVSIPDKHQFSAAIVARILALPQIAAIAAARVR